MNLSIGTDHTTVVQIGAGIGDIAREGNRPPFVQNLLGKDDIAGGTVKDMAFFTLSALEKEVEAFLAGHCGHESPAACHIPEPGGSDWQNASL
ncbi:MAG: hypothetical protein MZV63_14945 [Marinilabiliales bacterium]|nr:hypothetical protein [Marinilabiliales bacterium]